MSVSSILSSPFTKTYKVELSLEEQNNQEFVWERKKTQQFDELILSWNGIRPKKGKWTFWVSLFVKEWSPWIRYAEWGPNLQKTFKHVLQSPIIESYQDRVYLQEGVCDMFRVKVSAEKEATLEHLETLSVCLSHLSRYSIHLPSAPLPSVLLPEFPRRSQLKLNHPRSLDLCSPTATSSALHFLGSSPCDPVAFSEKVRDLEFDIYGNWVLNTAQAFQELKGKFYCRVERLFDFSLLHSFLMKGLPVIASVRGPLIGAYRPFTFGHLLCVIGYAEKEKKVLCIDSAFPDDAQTFVSYPLSDFLQAWARKQNVCYLFSPRNSATSLL